eukprot:TRINITY_DN106746_c0_g1_i1.p1 TRINITY_DN106746_c0_g1~~TRINITY_DN106746_c0_g1_i1.p1  ORF type:complete len:214 (+),score=25.30 TRINITY_DN106746_c0_g1_i1:94-735(+)
MGKGPGWNQDGFAMAAATGATNIFLFPCVIVAWKLGLYYEMVIAFFTFATSAAYHTCESLNVKFLGFNEGRWHHADNVFAILGFMAIISLYSPLRHAGLRECINAMWVSIAVTAQLMSPWNIQFTVVPILIALVYVLISIAIARRLPVVDGRAGLKALAILAVAVFFFVKGLDEKKDWLRLYHGGWHVCVGPFFCYALVASRPSNVEDKKHAD